VKEMPEWKEPFAEILYNIYRITRYTNK